jgi:DNA-binding beta-propeller fold protein YncE
LIQTHFNDSRRRRSFVFVAATLAALWHVSTVSAFEAVITNERSGDVIHIDNEGSTAHITALCNRPRGMTKGLDDSHVIIACSDDHKVVSYNRKTRTIDSEIVNVPGAMSISLHKPSGRLLVTNEGTSQASVYNLDSGRLIAELPTGLEPDGIVITDDGKLIFVASENAGLVHVFDGENYQPLDVIRTNLRPRRIALLKQELWVSSEMGSRVEIFDTKTRMKIDEVIFAPKGFRPEQMTPVDILFNPNQNEAYVALGGANHVAIVDTTTREITKYILVGRRAWGLGLSPDAQTLIVLNGLSDDFTMIDLNTRRPILTKRAGLIPHSIEVFE